MGLQSFEDATGDWTTELQQPLDHDMRSVDDVSDIFAAGHINNNNIEYPVSNFGHAPSQSVADSDLSVPSLDFDIDTLAASSVNTGSSNIEEFARPTRSLAPTRLRSRLVASIDSQCILACTQIIINLENYIITDLKALDIILGIIKKAIDTLHKLINLQQDSRSFRIQALFGVIMYQIIELLETGCAGFLVEHTKAATQGLDKLDSIDVGGYLPGLGFGTFQIDAEDKRSWRAQIVLKALRQSSEILQKIVSLARIGHIHDLQQQAGSEREPCYADLERRLKSLCEEVRKAGSSCL